MGKIINNNQLLGALGETFVRDMVLRMGHVFEFIRTDAGLDGTIELRDPVSGEMQNLILRVQVKSTSSFHSDDGHTFSFTCDTRDIEYWLKGNAPNILVVCNPHAREAYWKSIRDYFSTPEVRKTRTIRFSKTHDVFDQSAGPRLFALARPTDSGLYMEAPRSTETLTLNLLPVSTLPTTLHIAPTECTSTREVYAKASDMGARLPPELVFSDKTIISVHDFRADPAWRHVCECGAAEPVAFTERFTLTSPADCNLAAQFLYRCLEGFAAYAGLRYYHSDRVFFVPYVKHDGTAQTRPFRSSRRHSTRHITRGLVTPLGGRAHGFKHCAFHAEFLLVESRWFLQISPTYFYTSDGYRKKFNADEFLAVIKRRERNRAVYSQLRLWEQYLCSAGRHSLLDAGYAHMAFGQLETCTIARAVPDVFWSKADIAVDRDSSEALWNED